MLTHADYRREQKIADAAVESAVDHTLVMLGDIAADSIQIESALRIAMDTIDESMSYRDGMADWLYEAVHDGLIDMMRHIHDRAQQRREDMEADEIFHANNLDQMVAWWAESPNWEQCRAVAKHPQEIRSVTDLSRDPD